MGGTTTLKEHVLEIIILVDIHYIFLLLFIVAINNLRLVQTLRRILLTFGKCHDDSVTSRMTNISYFLGY